MSFPPPQLHISFELLFSAGILPIITVGDPGAQGAAVTGTHGMGVSTPSAAAVAAATIGFDGELHIPNGGIFAIGMLTIIVAAGGPPPMVAFVGSTTRLLRATPKLHCLIAPMHT